MNSDERFRALGRRAPLPPKIDLRAGDLVLSYENGAIRQIRLGSAEVIRMIYSAVRDQNWGTVEPVIRNEEMTIQENSFEITLHVSYQKQEIHFEADYRITGSSNRLRFEMEGLAVTSFLKNRIGFCVLHPIRECAGKSGRAIHPDGKTSDFIFPEQISPVQPVKEIQSMAWKPARGVDARLIFSGDIFEMEDQRNWTDASFKTYCTPLGLPFPAEIKSGEKLSQSVELVVNSKALEIQANQDFYFTWKDEVSYQVPNLGVSVSSRPETLSQLEIAQLKRLPVSHFRVELKMQQTDVELIFEKALRESLLLDWPLFIVLYFSENCAEEYRQFVSFCVGSSARISHILPVGINHLPHPVFEEISGLIRSNFPGAAVGTGVNAYFAELNRARPKTDKADFVSFTICPQVHAFDHWSLVENIEAQSEVLKSAKNLFPGKPVFVSPVSLRQRFNVVATAAEPDPAPGTLPASVDVRQRSVFAGSWMSASLKTLAQSGCCLITFFEAVGWKGMMQGEKPSPVKALFRASENEIFPVFDVLNELSGFQEIIHAESSNPLLFDGMVLRSPQRSKLLIWSFSDLETDVKLACPIDVLSARSLLYATAPSLSGQRITLRPMDLAILEF